MHTAVPFVVGDSYENLPIIGVLPTLFDTPLTRVRDAVNGGAAIWLDDSECDG